MCFGLDIQALIVGRIQQGHVRGLDIQVVWVEGLHLPLDIQVARARIIGGRAVCISR